MIISPLSTFDKASTAVGIVFFAALGLVVGVFGLYGSAVFPFKRCRFLSFVIAKYSLGNGAARSAGAKP